MKETWHGCYLQFIDKGIEARVLEILKTGTHFLFALSTVFDPLERQQSDEYYMKAEED